MPKWEVRRVTGRGFLKDLPIAAYEPTKEFGLKELELLHYPRHVGKMEDFVEMDHLLPKAKGNRLTNEDLESLQTSWEGEPLPVGTVYCVITDFDNQGGAPAEGPSTASTLKAAFQQKIEDKVVQAQGDRLFKSGGADAEARKNVAQAERSEGGVWGAKRKGPPRL